jgi:hypothetical protein
MPLPYPGYLNPKPGTGAHGQPPLEYDLDFDGLFREVLTNPTAFDFTCDITPPPPRAVPSAMQESAWLDQALTKLFSDPAFNAYVTELLNKSAVPPQEVISSNAKEALEFLYHNTGIHFAPEKMDDLKQSLEYALVSLNTQIGPYINTLADDAKEAAYSTKLTSALDYAYNVASTMIAGFGLGPARTPAPLVIDVSGAGANAWKVLRQACEEVINEHNTAHPVALALPKAYKITDHSADEFTMDGGGHARSPKLDMFAQNNPSANGFTLKFPPDTDNLAAFTQVKAKVEAAGLNLKYVVKESPGGIFGFEQLLKIADSHPTLKFSQAVIDQFRADLTVGAATPPPTGWDKLNDYFDARKVSHPGMTI